MDWIYIGRIIGVRAISTLFLKGKNHVCLHSGIVTTIIYVYLLIIKTRKSSYN